MSRRTEEKPAIEIYLYGSLARDIIAKYPVSLIQAIIQCFPGDFDLNLLRDPNTHERISISYLVDEVYIVPGGTGANLAYNLALHDLRPKLGGSIGSAPEDLAYLQYLQDQGIDTSRVFQSKKTISIFNAITDIHNSQLAWFLSGAMSDPEANLSLKDLKEKNAFVIIAPHDPHQMDQQLDECRELGLRLFFDIGQQIKNVPPELVCKGAEIAELVIVNQTEMNALTQILNEHPANIIPICITTRGEFGSVIEGRHVSERRIEIPVVPVEHVVDPTGAGDAFRAAFLKGFLDKGYALDICGYMGSFAGSIAVQHPGGQGHRFTWEEFVRGFNHYFSSKGIQIEI